MIWVLIAVLLVAALFVVMKKKRKGNLSVLPERFIVFDLETTGLKPEVHEIIEVAAIRVNRDSNNHDTFQILIRPAKKIPKKITELTGITEDMLEKDGKSLESALTQFLEFIGDLPLVSYNAEFDIAFLSKAATQMQQKVRINNRVSCALKMARRAWPGRKTYRLPDLASEGGLSAEETHRALGDCNRALIVYAAAASKLGSAT